VLPISVKKGIEIIKAQVATMPKAPGVYRMIDHEGKILYVGKAKNLPKRVISYTRIEQLPNRLRRMVSQITTIEVITTQTEAQALLLESSMIKALQPRFNIALRDDKSFPYILIDETHPYPRITKYRGKKMEGGTYFGPFASASSVKDTITELQKLFQIRPCSNSFFESRDRPCLQHQIKRCSAPCVRKVTEEEYRGLIEQTKEFLSGKSDKVQKRLIAEMQEASNKHEYEKAAMLRDRIQLLTKIQAKNIFSDGGITDADVLAIAKHEEQYCVQIFFIRGSKNYGNKTYFPRGADSNESEVLSTAIGQFYQVAEPPKLLLVNVLPIEPQLLEEALSQLAGRKVKIAKPLTGSKADLVAFAFDNATRALKKYEQETSKQEELLRQIAELFGIDEDIKRIEIYDNSHISGQHAVGCMVVAGREGFIKSEYRKYIIKENFSEADDYAMLREVLTRRLKRLTEDNMPNIMLIDGGKGHFTVTNEVLERFGVADQIKVVCIAKGRDRNAGREWFFTDDQPPFQLPPGDSRLYYLERLRDEVHRFAIQTHRKRRSKAISFSVIERIPKIGVKRKKALLQFFGSPDAIREATVEDLARVEGVSKNLAAEIYNYLRK
jgi:excinuclease ABC subunit C